MIKRLALVILVVAISSRLMVAVRRPRADACSPLTEPGPYGARLIRPVFVDESRDDWKIDTFVFFPADKTQGTPVMGGSLILRDAPADRMVPLTH